MLGDQGTSCLVRSVGQEGRRAGPGLHRNVVTGSLELSHQVRNQRNAGLAGSQLPGYRDAHITNLVHADLSESS
jgi:hypothetical protein